MHRWNGSLPRMQLLVFNSALLMPSLEEKDFGTEYLCLLPLCYLNTNLKWSIIYCFQIFSQINTLCCSIPKIENVKRETRNCVLFFLFYKLMIQTYKTMEREYPRIETKQFSVDISHNSSFWYVFPSLSTAI